MLLKYMAPTPMLLRCLYGVLAFASQFKAQN